jgi:hypothetical protein
LVNLNVSADSRPSASAGARVSRLVLMAMNRDGTATWRRSIQRLVKMVPARSHSSWGRITVMFRDGQFEVTAALQRYPLVLEACLHPLCVPLGSREVQVGEGSIGWFAIPLCPSADA